MLGTLLDMNPSSISTLRGSDFDISDASSPREVCGTVEPELLRTGEGDGEGEGEEGKVGWP